MRENSLCSESCSLLQLSKLVVVAGLLAGIHVVSPFSRFVSALMHLYSSRKCAPYTTDCTHSALKGANTFCMKSGSVICPWCDVAFHPIGKLQWTLLRFPRFELQGRTVQFLVQTVSFGVPHEVHPSRKHGDIQHPSSVKADNVKTSPSEIAKLTFSMGWIKRQSEKTLLSVLDNSNGRTGESLFSCCLRSEWVSCFCAHSTTSEFQSSLSLWKPFGPSLEASLSLLSPQC